MSPPGSDHVSSLDEFHATINLVIEDFKGTCERVDTDDQLLSRIHYSTDGSTWQLCYTPKYKREVRYFSQPIYHSYWPDPAHVWAGSNFANPIRDPHF